jgi:hypothetical protein
MFSWATTAPAKRAPPTAAELAELRALVGPDVDQQLRDAGQEGLTDAYLARWLVARKGSPAAAKLAINKEAAWRTQLAAKGPITEVRDTLCYKPYQQLGTSLVDTATQGLRACPARRRAGLPSRRVSPASSRAEGAHCRPNCAAQGVPPGAHLQAA